MTQAQPHRRLVWAAMGAASLHLALLFALDQGLLRARPPEPVRLIDLMARVIEPVTVQPTPIAVEVPRPMAQSRPPREPLPSPVRPATPVPPRADKAEAMPARAPSPTAPALAETVPAAPSAEPPSTTTVSPPHSASASAPPAAAPGTAAPARQPALELPSSQAGYLNNPLPLYPKASERLREQGRSVVRVLINASGVPQSAEVVESSGFTRLDRAAQATAMAWRYVPGKRAGVPEAMAVDVPIVWRLPD